MAESSKAGSAEIINYHMQQALKNQLVEITNMRMIFAKILGELEGLDEFSKTLHENILKVLVKEVEARLIVRRRIEDEKRQHFLKIKKNRHFMLKKHRALFFIGNAEGA